MEKTSLNIIAIIALLLSVVAIGYVFVNQSNGDLSKIQSDISSLKSGVNDLVIDVSECNKDISNIDVNPKCYCDVNSDDLEDLEDELQDDINDLEDDVEDYLDDGTIESCFTGTQNWTNFKDCVVTSF